MKRKLFLLASILLVMSTAAQAQQTLVNTFWHNGYNFISIPDQTDSSYTTFMGTLHEGADAQPFLKTSSPDLFFHPNQLGNAWTDTIIYFRDSIIHKTIARQEVLLLYGYGRTLLDIFIRYDGTTRNSFYTFAHGLDTLLESEVRRQIIGTYRTNGQTWTITPDSVIISKHGSRNQRPTSFAYNLRWGNFDNLERILILSDGRNLDIAFTPDGIDLYNGIIHHEDDIDWVTRGQLLCHLSKTNLDQPVPGRWPEASTRLLTRGYLNADPLEVLRLIRNEIFARRGYRFSDPKLVSYFGKEGRWYSQALNNPATQPLSEIETLNIQLIKTIEYERQSQSNNK